MNEALHTRVLRLRCERLRDCDVRLFEVVIDRRQLAVVAAGGDDVLRFPHFPDHVHHHVAALYGGEHGILIPGTERDEADLQMRDSRLLNKKEKKDAGCCIA